MSTILADSLGSPADRDQRPPGDRARPRWQVWRSPDDQPRWARPALLGIAAAAAVLYGWNLTRAGYAPFYSVAVKSMSESWKALFYGAFDPSATITIDKLAGSFVPQALSARIFGYSAWSLALPQVIEGVVSVLVMYRVVRRWAGAPAGLLAAAIFTLTPIAASMFGHSMEDGALTMCLVLAADAYQRAVTEARLRSLILAGAWVGLGFQAKMLQAWMVLPALAIGYLIAAPASFRRRLWQLAAAGAVMLAVSLSWIALYTLTPASDRPYIDGSTNNSAVAMVFGYNGLERFGITVNGAVTSGPGVTTSRPGATGPGAGRQNTATFGQPPAAGSTGSTPGEAAPARTRTGTPAGFTGAPGASSGTFGSGWTKLLGSEYGPEIGWLYPLAVLALAAGLTWSRRAKRDDPIRAGFLMWGTWLLTYGLIFSKMTTIPHTAYVASLAPPLAALAAAGTVMFWRAFRAGGWQAWALPAAVAAELAWTLFLWHYYPGFLPWARDTAAAAGATALILMATALLSRRARARGLTPVMILGTAAMITAPAAWAASVLDTAYAGSSFNASAGPAGTSNGPGAGGLTASTTTTLTTAEQSLYNYITAHRDGASYLLAVESWQEAGTYILATGQEVLNMGGFSGTVPAPTLTQVKNLVHTGQLRYFLIGEGAGLFGAASGQSTTTAIDSWVTSACAKVPATDYSTSSTGNAGSAGPGAAISGAAISGTGIAGTGTLYACTKNA